MKNFEMKKTLLLLITVVNIYSSELPNPDSYWLTYGSDPIHSPPALLAPHLTPLEQAKVKLAVKTIENIFKKRDRQGRAAAYNLLGLPFEIQINILNMLTPQERADISKMSDSHRELMWEYANWKSNHAYVMKNGLDLSKERENVNVNFIIKLAKLYPNIKKLMIRDPDAGLSEDDVNNLLQVFPNLEHIEIKDLYRSLITGGRKALKRWGEAAPGRTFLYTFIEIVPLQEFSQDCLRFLQELYGSTEPAFEAYSNPRSEK